MTEQELKLIHTNNQTMARLQEEYNDICSSIGCSGKKSDGMPHGSGGKSTGMPDIEDKIDIEMEYRRIYRENQKLIARAIKYIMQFPDEILRRILTAKYINTLDIVEIATDVGLTMKQCEEICKVHFNNVF